MEILRELILKPADIDRISIQCESCGALVELSLSAVSRAAATSDASEKSQQIPGKCPSCPDEWNEIRTAVGRFGADLRNLEQYRVTFRITNWRSNPPPQEIR